MGRPIYVSEQNCWICVNGICGANIGSDPCTQSTMCTNGCILSADCCGPLTWLDVAVPDEAPDVAASVAASPLGEPSPHYTTDSVPSYLVSANGTVREPFRRPCPNPPLIPFVETVTVSY
jgi:hypothetical protein